MNNKEYIESLKRITDGIARRVVADREPLGRMDLYYVLKNEIKMMEELELEEIKGENGVEE